MRLFEIGPDYLVELNKVWIALIPEFANLLKRDKGSAGDYRGEKKLKARREFAFIYFDLDFTSPIREWDEFERREEAMKYAGLTEADMDAAVMDAHRKYNELLLKSSRSLKTLRAVEKSLDAMDQYFEGIDFKERDKKGEMVHNPNTHLKNIEGLGKAYDALDKFRKRVEEELKGDQSIRGAATLGLKEGKRQGSWDECDAAPSAADPVPQTSFSDIAKMLHSSEEGSIVNDEDEEL